MTESPMASYVVYWLQVIGDMYPQKFFIANRGFDMVNSCTAD